MSKRLRFDLIGTNTGLQVLEKAPNRSKVSSKFAADGPRSYVEDEDFGQVRRRITRVSRALEEPRLTFTIISTAPAAPDYDDGIVWDLVDPDSLGPMQPLASHEVTMHFEKVERGRFAPLDIDDVDLELFDA